MLTLLTILTCRLLVKMQTGNLRPSIMWNPNDTQKHYIANARIDIVNRELYINAFR